LRTLQTYDKQIPKAPKNIFTQYDSDVFYDEYDDCWIDDTSEWYDDVTLIMVEDKGLSVTYVSYNTYSFWPPEMCDIDYVLATTSEYDLQFGTGAEEQALEMFPEYFI